MRCHGDQVRAAGYHPASRSTQPPNLTLFSHPDDAGRYVIIDGYRWHWSPFTQQWQRYVRMVRDVLSDTSQHLSFHPGVTMAADDDQIDRARLGNCEDGGGGLAGDG